MLIDKLPADHPLRSAVWIWPEAYMYLHNHYAHFRRDFELATVPATAPLAITADKAYKLYVNGSYVCRGPARGYQEHWPFDEVDLAPYLRAGHNWLAVEAYTPGISTFQYLHQGWSGLLCAARWGEFSLVSDAKWQMRRSPAHATQTARYSMQIDFQEHVDGRRLDRRWITDATAPADYWGDRMFAHGQNSSNLPFGRPPWTTLEPRGIPLLRETLATPTGLFATATGASGADYQTRENVSWGWVAEAQDNPTWAAPTGIATSVADGWLTFTVPPTGAGRYQAVMLDLGRIVVHNLAVRVSGAAGGELLDFQIDQCQRQLPPQYPPPGDACMAAMANRLRLAAGHTEHEFFHLLAGRQVTVIARDVTQPLTIAVRVRVAGYPFTMRGEFSSSDATLNDIHAACRHTQQICALDAYVDTPWREQAQWWGDARVQAANTFYLDGDARLFARGIRSIAGQSTSDGLTFGHAPTVAVNCILPDFSLTWILTIWDHYWQTGDLTLFNEQWPRIQEVLAYFDSPLARGPHGLLRHDTRFWYFGDWADLYRGEVPTFLNLWYLHTVRQVAAMLKLVNDPRGERHWGHVAKVHEKLVRTHLYDRTTRTFIGGLDAAGQPASAPPSVHDQVLALMLDLAPPGAPATMMSHFLLPYLREEKQAGAIPSSFWCTYLLAEAGRRGCAAEVVDFIRRKWAPMLTTGSIWEAFAWHERCGGSCTHAWSAHPAYHLVNWLVGLRQSAPAWAAVTLAPNFVADLSHAHATVPSPAGLITAGWTRTGDRVEVEFLAPAGVTAEVLLPGGRKETCTGMGGWTVDLAPGA